MKTGRKQWINILLCLFLLFGPFFGIQGELLAQAKESGPSSDGKIKTINVKIKQEPLKELFGKDQQPDFAPLGISKAKKVDLPRSKKMKKSRYEETAWYTVEIPEGEDSAVIMERLSQEVDVLYVEENPERYLLEGITDPLLEDQWHLDAIKASEAWGYVESLGLPDDALEDVVVAVIDSGIRTTHEDLVDTLWVNGGEIPGNGLDDDENGYIDDVHGYNTYDDNSNIEDVNGHGTHVAGIIAASRGNGLGGAGVSDNVRIMPVRASSPTGSLTAASTIAALAYAVENGAQVVNMSYGGYVGSVMEAEAYLAASEQAVLVAAAGNEGRATSSAKSYPAAYPGVLGVMSTDPAPKSDGDYLSDFSNWDNQLDDGIGYEVMAPGGSILSTFFTGDQAYGNKSGTSMATPVVTGMAGLLRGLYPDPVGMTPGEIGEQIIQSGTIAQGITYNNVVYSYPYVDLEKALKMPNAMELVQDRILLHGAEDSLQMQVDVLPQYADPSMTWESVHEQVALVDDGGNVTASGYGATVLVGTSLFGGLSVMADVVVSEAPVDQVTGLAWKSQPTNTQHDYGTPMDLSDGVVKVIMDSGLIYEMPLLGSMVEGYDPFVLGEQQLTVEFFGYQLQYTVEVADVLESIQMKTLPNKIAYLYGEAFAPTGGMVQGNMVSGASTQIPLTTEMVTGYDPYRLGNQQLTVTYDGKTTSFGVRVDDYATSIQMKTLPTKRTYNLGESLNTNGGIVTANMASGAKQDAGLTTAMVTGFDPNKLGTQTLTVSYLNKTTTFTVTVVQQTFGVTFSVDGPGGSLNATVDGKTIASGAKVIHGKTVQLTAIPSKRYRVYEWKVNDSLVAGTETSKSVTVNKETTVNVTFVLEGDLNDDGTSNITDLVTLRRYLAGLTNVAGKGKIAADINNDGSINITDLVILRRRLAGLE
ncbi:S8 family serine peptidase [Alkalibacter rhizosphaerae]|uniref:S8 family serine peptidase n=1 Tax=Alkalibacter rhizosphaerae TaxID=2815577 RepID=A0A975AIM9_9FIRM|nr:S8 family serine peptidase [Alkalibacter rhizosphaerae]QSX09263.1 S8 family serine peptidase [Alkalibacter rhizosphaerae]